MNWFSRLFFSKERKMTSRDLFLEVYGGRQSAAGVRITPENALEVATVFACIRVRANGVAQVPFRLYQEVDGKKRVATEHPLHRLVYRKPNPWQTSFELRETLMFHLSLTGQAFCWLGRVGNNREIRSIEPIEPGRVTIVRPSPDVIFYDVRGDDGRVVRFNRDEIWHLKGPSWNSYVGMSAIDLARDMIGLTRATETTQADYHRNGLQTTGAFIQPDVMGKERHDILQKYIREHVSGASRSGAPLLLDGGMNFPKFGMNAVDAQLIETRRHQIEEICRFFGVMPIMIGHSDKTSTYASAEQMFIAHVVHGLTPYYERIEQSADAALLSDEEVNAGYYFKFTPNALMRGAARDRAEFYTKALGAGGHGTAWMTPNEVRDFEELEPIEGGDALPSPQTMNAGAAANDATL